MSVLELTETGIKKFITTGHVVINVCADQCGPCDMYAPVFLEVSEQYPEIKFGKLKLQKNPDGKDFLPSEFKRTWMKTALGQEPYGTPTTLVFKDGKLLYEADGKKSVLSGAFMDKTRLKHFIEKGYMPAREVNPLVAALPPETRAALLEKEALFVQITEVRNSIDKLNQLVSSGNATEDDRVERMFLTEKMEVLNLDLQSKSQQIKELLVPPQPPQE